MYSLALIIFVVSEKKAFEYFNIVPYGKNVSKRFFSETTWTIETKLPRNSHWKVLYKVYVFFMPIENSRWLPPQVGSNVKLSSAVAAILNFIPEQKTYIL
jgi:hypothetical protein